MKKALRQSIRTALLVFAASVMMLSAVGCKETTTQKHAVRTGTVQTSPARQKSTTPTMAQKPAQTSPSQSK